MAEQNLYSQFLLAASKLRKVILFRNNTGMAWVGQIIKKTPTELIIRNPRVLHAGLIKGSSDLIGWSIVAIGPQHIGQNMAVFTAIEVKTKNGKVSPEQLNFLQRVAEAGGISGIAIDENDINTLLKTRQDGEYSGTQNKGKN